MRNSLGANSQGLRESADAARCLYRLLKSMVHKTQRKSYFRPCQVCLPLLWVSGAYKMRGMETLGDRIKKYRELRGFSQELLGRLLGVSREAVSQWESNTTDPRPRRVRQIATALGITYPVLLLGDEMELQSNIHPLPPRPPRRR